MNNGDSNRRVIRALKVHQWLAKWDKVDFSDSARRRPEPHFYLFTLPAVDLKALTGISRRTIDQGGPRAADLGIQRRHDAKRSDKIRDFVHYGYPWSELGTALRKSPRFNHLAKPGWLPTAIVVNILKPGDTRRGREVAPEDAIGIVLHEDTSSAQIELPDDFDGSVWRPKINHPIKVIDGQHRLWAFEDDQTLRGFELPVVAFYDLDVSWEAYLFWSINITPKRINASLAFDLYPLLRTEDWLEKFEGPTVYREARSQELTEMLWSYPGSPWHNRINMLGEPGQNTVTQAAWVRALMNTYIKSSEGPGVRMGGLFGAPVGSDELVLPWNRAQQGAFLIYMWQQVESAIKRSDHEWANALRTGQEDMFLDMNAAFAGPYSLLNTDQGVRGILHVTNDLCFANAAELELDKWGSEFSSEETTDALVEKALAGISNLPVASFLTEIGEGLASYDWRTAAAPGLSRDMHEHKLVFRGSGGYRELRRQLLDHLRNTEGRVSQVAEDIYARLRY